MAGKKKDNIHLTPDVSYIRNPDVAHEHTDVPVTPVLKFIFGLLVFAIVVHVLMWLMFVYLDRREQRAERRPSPLVRRGAERLPPEPRLQMAPGWNAELEDGRRVDLTLGQTRPDLYRPQAEKELVFEHWIRELNNYGWADQAAGTARIPIEDAMKLYTQQQQQRNGAQPAPPPGSERLDGERIPSDPSSGHRMEQKIP